MGDINASGSVKARFAWGPSGMIDAALDRLQALSPRIEKGLFASYLTGYRKASELDLKGRTVVIAAFRAPLYELGVDMGGRTAYVPLPPTYIVRDAQLSAVDDAVVEAFGRAVPIRAPFKTLAVALGLGRYGRNNIVYVAGMGSYLRLRCYIAEEESGASADTYKEFLRRGFDEGFVAEGCEGCSICAASCPTGALPADGFLVNAGRCLTYANEEPGRFPGWVKDCYHNCLVGCMRCQGPCPMNQGMLATERLDEGLDGQETAWLLGDADETQGPMPAKVGEKLSRMGVDYGLEIIRRNLKALHRAGRL